MSITLNPFSKFFMFPAQYVFLALMVLFFVLTLRGRSLTDSRYRIRLIAWVFLWVGGAVAVLFPRLLSRVADYLGIGRGVDVVLYVGMMALTYLVFRMMIRLYVIEREITTLVQHIALKDVDQRDKH